jgi:hypothetical protein
VQSSLLFPKKRLKVFCWLSNSDEPRFTAAEVRDLRQRFFTSVFPKLIAGVLLFESLLVKVIKIATLHAAQPLLY